jgi:hypothetical protein
MENLEWRPSNESENRNLKILRYLGEHGPANKYRIRKESGAGSQPTVLASVDELERTGKIKSQETIAHARGGQPSYLYDLTLLGLAELMRALTPRGTSIGDIGTNVKNLLDHLAKKYSDLMPPFGQLWPALREVGADGNTMLGPFVDELCRWHKKFNSKKAANDCMCTRGVEYLLAVGPFYVDDMDPSTFRAIRKQLKRLRGNTVLRKATMKQLADAANELREEARNYLWCAKEYEKLAKWFVNAD